MWPAKDKGAINTRASARDKFGSWCASSHATGQSPSTITGVPVVREADVITALNYSVEWASAMGAVYSPFTHVVLFQVYLRYFNCIFVAQNIV